MMSARLPYTAIYAAIVLMYGGRSASAAILGFNAEVSTSVQELIDGEPGSISSDRDALGEETALPPLVASAELMSTDLDGRLTGVGQGFSEFLDPTRVDQPNPEEFGLEVACFSDVPSVSYSVRGSANETRRVVFTTPGSVVASPETTFEADGTREIESRVFLSGAVVVWSTASQMNLNDLTGELRLEVTRDGVDAALFSTVLSVAGAGTGQVDFTGGGPIRFEEVDADELFPTPDDAGAVSALGTLIVAVIPDQEHTYTYTVTADEPVALTATLTAHVRNLPDGTGIAATLGRPFENLAAVINLTPAADGAAVERSVNKAIAERAVGLVPPPATLQPRGPLGGLCGVFGVEAAAMVLIPGGLLTRSRARRRPR